MGEWSYEVRVNGKVISGFKHIHSEGLAKCLRLAADSVEKFLGMK